jgi:hypothetical protein
MVALLPILVVGPTPRSAHPRAGSLQQPKVPICSIYVAFWMEEARTDYDPTIASVLLRAAREGAHCARKDDLVRAWGRHKQPAYFVAYLCDNPLWDEPNAVTTRVPFGPSIGVRAASRYSSSKSVV